MKICIPFTLHLVFVRLIAQLFTQNPGQNKNQTVVCMLGHMLMKHPTLNSIQLKFLEAGHTYMPCDTAHSAIEREGRSKSIHIPQDWIPVIRNACNSNPYTTEELFYYNFKDFKALKDQVCYYSFEQMWSLRVVNDIIFLILNSR